jgi:hypothetical protein
LHATLLPFVSVVKKLNGHLSSNLGDCFRNLRGQKEPGKQGEKTFNTITKGIVYFLVQNTDIFNLPGWQVVGCEGEDHSVIEAKPGSPDLGASQ